MTSGCFGNRDRIVNAPQRELRKLGARPVNHRNVFRQQILYAVLENGVRVAATDFMI